jgi:hypothetical protein
MDVVICVMITMAVLVVTGLRQRAWILIPLCWTFVSKTAIFRIPLSMRDYSMMLACGTYLIYRVVSGQTKPRKWDWLDVLLAFNLMYLGFLFLRRPVGFLSMGSQMVGGRYVFDIFLAAVSYAVIWRMAESAKTVQRLPLIMLVGSALAASLFVLTYFLPGLPARLPFLYVAFNVDAYLGTLQTGVELVRRYWQFGPLGLMIGLTVCAYTPPSLLFNPLKPRFYVMAVCGVCILASGFRSMLISMAAYVVLSAWLHRGKWQALVLAGVIAAGVLLLALGQGRLYELPLPAQRAMTFLPGRWDPIAVLDARGSSEGRFDWWRLTLQERLIKNWWMGDGLGMSFEDLASRELAGTVEGMNAMGQHHSGPLSAIRFTGIVGLGLLYCLMIGAAVFAWRSLKLCRGTPFEPIAFLQASVLVWMPINYTFIFGGYDSDMPNLIFQMALLRLVRHQAQHYKPQPSSTPATPAPARLKPVPVFAAR